MKYSVIIPVYNKAETIAESIKSVLAQTEQNFELIIVNDGSSDNLQEAIKDFPSIRVINQENGGVSVARNTGIKEAKGDYVCFLDADDLYLPNHLEELNFLIKEYPQAVMFFTSHIETFTNGETRNISNLLPKFPDSFLCENLFKLLNENSYSLIHTNCACINRNFINKNGIYFEPGEKIGEDTDMWFRVALNGSVAYSKKETTIYRRENSTATRNGSNSFSWVFARRWDDIEKGDYSEDRKRECRKLIERHFLTSSRNYMLLKDRKKAKDVLRNIKYRNKRYYLTWILARMPYSLSRWIITHV